MTDAPVNPRFSGFYESVADHTGAIDQYSGLTALTVRKGGFVLGVNQLDGNRFLGSPITWLTLSLPENNGASNTAKHTW